MAVLSGGASADLPAIPEGADPVCAGVAPAPLRLVADNEAAAGPAEPVVPPRLAAWLDAERPATPHLAIDLEAVAARYDALADALAPARLHYAMKACPEAPVLRMLAARGARFDVASRGEIDQCLALGISAARLSFGNTLKKRGDIADAYAKGVRLFAFDSAGELDKLAAAAPGAALYCRLLTDGAGADWPLSRKFGCPDDMADGLLRAAYAMGFRTLGLSFHVGSQQTGLAAWDGALARAAALYDRLAADGIRLALVNIGGGFPARYRGSAPDPVGYARSVGALVRRVFGPARPVDLIAEPGRGLVADAGVIEAEVVLVADKGTADARRWVYLDIGKFTGLAETMDEAIRYRIATPHDGGPTGPAVLAGPTCDSADVLYEKAAVELPLALKEGDRVRLVGCGAYTRSYASIGFNGFAAPECSCF